MRTDTRRWWSWSAAGALALTLGAPGLASAQQGGLFPNAGIRRERVPCENEDPIYRLYRHEYFGYHPTCWRRFPDGWGCPSPEAPNAAAEFQKLPRDKPPELGPDDMGPGPGPGPDDGDNPNPQPGGGGRGPARPAPNALPPLPSGDRNPFDLDSRPSTPPAGNPPAGDGLPSLPGPGGDTPPPAAAPTPSDGAPGAALAPVDSQPLLALPDPTVNPAARNAPQMTGFPLPNGETPLPPPMPTTTPAQAPRRTGMLGNLFSGRIFRR
ncbi:MAG: hypothetical protein U0835_20885 [Isosphaeraceae bacterium]